MPLPQDKYYTTDDYFNTPSNERFELIDGQFMLNAYTFQDKINVGIYEDLCIDFSTFDLHK